MGAPSTPRITGQLRVALAASGPFGAVILAKTGWSQADYALYVELAVAVLPYLISAAWSWWARRDSALVRDASNVKGATVVVDRSASLAVQNVAKTDNTAPDVVTEQAFLEKKAI